MARPRAPLRQGLGWAVLGVVVHHNASNGDGLRHQDGVITNHRARLYGVFSDAQLGLVGFFHHRIQGDGADVAVGQGDHEGIDGLRYSITIFV
nr:hypothetical protein [Xylella fastidiosa]